jgi:type II secretory pathway pseudopilin PulG
MFKFLKSQAGFSMVQVMLAAAMMGGLALVLSKMGQNQSQMQRKAIEDQDLNEITNRIQRHLLNDDACRNTFVAANVVLNTTGSIAPINEIRSKDNNLVFQIGTEASPTYKVSSITVERLPDQQLDLAVTLSKKIVGKSFGASEITKHFQLGASFDLSNKITKCFSQLDGAIVSACSALGGTMSGANCTNTLLHAELNTVKAQLTTAENNIATIKTNSCAFETYVVQQIGGVTKNCTTPYTNRQLIGGAHTEYHCTQAGGTAREAESGNWVCQFSGRNCPAGWTAHLNWSTTTGATEKCGVDRDGGSCFGGRCASISAAGWGKNNETSKSYGDDKCKIGCTCNGIKPNGPYYVYSYWSSRGCY